MKDNGEFDYEESAAEVTVKGWACRQCHRWFGKDEHMARWCCAKTIPCECGGRIVGSWASCKDCRDRKEAAKKHELFANAVKLTEWEGPIYVDGVTHNEGFFENVEEYLDLLVWNADLEIPDFVWVCDSMPMNLLSASEIAENACEDLFEDAADQVKGLEDLQSALDEFFDVNSSLVGWHPNHKKCLVLSEAQKREVVEGREEDE
ncbi:MAG TPA: hypothetical protein PLK06_01470 [bacterium]|nr:hypothetical protein [bacterium]